MNLASTGVAKRRVTREMDYTEHSIASKVEGPKWTGSSQWRRKRFKNSGRRYIVHFAVRPALRKLGAGKASQLLDHTDSSYSSIHSVYSGPAVAHPLIPFTNTRLCMFPSP